MELLCNPYLLMAPFKKTQSQVATSSLPSRITNGRNCYVTPAFSRVHKKREQNQKWLHHPCRLGGPQRGRNPYVLEGPQKKGTKSKVATSPLPSRRPTKGRHCNVTPCVLRAPKKNGTKSEVSTSTVPSHGPTCGRNCNVTPEFSGVPKQGDKTRKSYITLALSRAQKWEELLRNPCLLGGPLERRQNQKWLHHPCLRGGPQVDVIAT